MPKRRFPRQWAVSAIIAAIALSNGVSASTTSGRHGREQSTLDQPDVVNPVYSHIPASEAIPSGDASATAEQLLALFIDRHTAMDYLGLQLQSQHPGDVHDDQVRAAEDARAP
jgi:hypothetical protein